MALVSIQTPEHFPRWLRDSKEMRMWMRYSKERVVTVQCGYCNSAGITTLESLVLEAAEGQQFLRAHPRIRTLARQYLETDGRAAILTCFESVTDTARLDVISDEKTYEILHISGDIL
jgi:aerobic-type carbon monoxide dehydrogenase small subunit (CoxS/CutS family)